MMRRPIDRFLMGLAAVAAVLVLTDGPIRAQLNQSGGSGGGGGGGAVTQSTAGTNAQAWWMRLGDATNGPVAVKAASTAAAATDPGLVVTLSPNGAVVALSAGAAKVGVVTTDQTTHGTTDLVATDQTKINGVAVLTGNGVTGTGAQRLTIASDQTPFLLKTIPLHGCAGNTLDDVTSVNVATGAGTAATAADTCVFVIYANNTTGTAATLTVQDTSGTPIVYSTTFSVPANSDVTRDFRGHKFLGGVKLIAGTATAINVITIGVH
jgi:hypothetical protein